MSEAPARQPELVTYLDPDELIPNPRNPRTSLGDLTELTASIKAGGVLEPIIVAPSEVGGYLVLFGHRRRQAAIDAGLAAVPSIVRPEYAANDAEQLVGMLAENLHRADLTAVEEAEGYAQLAAFEWSADQIAERTGRKAERVRQGLAVAKLPEKVRPKVAEGDWTLEQAAGVEEFAHDEKALGRLARVTGSYLHYALADERAKRDRRATAAETRTRLADQGVRIITKPKDFPWGSAAVELHKLTDDKGRKLTPARHRRCAGHAAIIDTDGTPLFVCQHPKEYDHQVPPGYRHQTREEAKAEQAEAEARKRYQEDWAIAAKARRSFLREYLARRGKAPTGSLRTATTILYGYAAYRTPDLDGMADLLSLTSDDLAAALAQTADKTAETRLPLLMLAYAAAYAESNLDHASRRYGFNAALAVHWFDVMSGLGYPLSEVEQQAATELRRQAEEDAVADAETEEADTD